MEGLGMSGETSIFPCGIFQWDKEWNAYPGTPNYDLKRLALKSTAMRIYPNWANTQWSGQTSAIESDRNAKTEYLESLSEEEYEKLLSILEQDKSLQEKLGLSVYEE